MLGRWQVNAFLLARSGQPFTPTVGGDPANLGHTGYARPNLVGDPKLDNPTAAQWFDPAAFAIPVNASATPAATSCAPPASGTSTSASSATSDRRQDTLMIRLEAFNVFNNINLGNPAVAIDNPATVARITGMVGTPRQLQLSARFVY